jgi:hypothetical protein
MALYSKYMVPFFLKVIFTFYGTGPFKALVAVMQGDKFDVNWKRDWDNDK